MEVIIAQFCLTLETLCMVTHQAPLSMGFSRQEYWSVLPCPSLKNLPNPGIDPRSPTLQADSLPSEPILPKAQIQCLLFSHQVVSNSLWSPGLQHNQTQNSQSNWKRNIKLEALRVLISKYYKARMIKGFPCGSAGTESTCIAGNLGSLVWEDPPEKGKATHSCFLAWRIPWTV